MVSCCIPLPPTPTHCHLLAYTCRMKLFYGEVIFPSAKLPYTEDMCGWDLHNSQIKLEISEPSSLLFFSYPCFGCQLWTSRNFILFNSLFYFCIEVPEFLHNKCIQCSPLFDIKWHLHTQVLSVTLRTKKIRRHQKKKKINIIRVIGHIAEWHQER